MSEAEPTTTPRKRTAKVTAPKPELVVERRKVSDLLPDPANARRHSEKNINAIRASLRRFGQRKPLVLDRDGVVVAGNGTLEAMGQESWEWCDVVVYDGTPEEARAYALADNRTAELASWDGDVLATQIDTLPTDLRLDIGWTPEELDKIADAANGIPHDNGTEEPYEGRYEVVVECKDEGDQQSVYEALVAEGRTCRTLTL
jgi:hypothetical protein